MFRRIALPAAVLVLAVVATACGGDSTSTDQAAEGNAVADENTAGVEVSETLGEKPAIEVPGGEPPAELVVADIVEGEGPEVPPGATVETHYVGVGWDSGEQFDSSWDSGTPATFGLDQVIAGWTEGIPGMKVGGRRLLIIPGELAYGANPPPGSGIGPNETLVFAIDLVSVPSS